MDAPTGVDVAVLIVMAYTGWTKQNATAAVGQWRWLNPDWDAAYILGYLSPSERAWVERQKGWGGVGAIAPIDPSTRANEGE